MAEGGRGVTGEVCELEAVRRRLEEALADNERLRADLAAVREEGAKSRRRRRAYLEQTSDGVWCFEYDQPIPVDLPLEEQVRRMVHATLVECNDVCAVVYGRQNAEEAIGSKFLELVSLEPETFYEGLRDYARNHYRAKETINIQRLPNGESRYLRNNAQGIVENGHVVRVWGSFRDVTEYYRLEEQLRQSQKLEALGRLVGGIAHDFNNLLTVIGGQARLLVKLLEQHPLALDETLEIVRASDRAAHLTRQLLSLGRRSPFSPMAFDLREVLRGVESMLRRVLRENVTLVLEPGEREAMVFADSAQIEHVLMNLAINARDAMPQGGTMSMRVSCVPPGDARLPERLRERGCVRLSVQDTGVGMDEHTKARAFEPFFTTKPAHEGTGLGLATTYGVVVRSGGHIEVSSALGVGTTFEIFLPHPTGEEPEPVRERAAREPAPSAGRGETVLVVEDDAAVRKYVGIVLEGAGYRVLAAESPASARTIVAAEVSAPSLLLSDVVMPGGSALELAAELRAKAPVLRTLFMSGYPDEGFAAAARAGEFACVPKPFSPEELTSAVARALRGER